MLGHSDSESAVSSRGVRAIRHRKLGRVSFDEALKLQECAIARFRSTGEGLPVVFSMEHDPVITCGRTTNPSNLLLTDEEYRARGIELRRIDRGGDVTYHGPGQVVVYPIIALRDHGLRAGEYVKLLEEAMIRTCADWGVEGFRRAGFPGCWTDVGKIGAVGTAIKAGGITKHGFAFNVKPDLDHFKLIVPCGITDIKTATLSALADGTVRQDDVQRQLVLHFSNLLGVKLSE